MQPGGERGGERDIGGNSPAPLKPARGTFCFLNAEVLRSGRFKKMPVYADVLRVPSLISRHTLNLRTACLGQYTSRFLAVSHRWEKPLDPDSQGGQMQRLCEFLRSAEGTSFEYVWIDVSCMPQHCTAEGLPREKTQQEKLDFGRMLSQVNLLYLGCSVLIIMDRSYMSRFWTQFEAWLSFQSATSEGLSNHTSDTRRNYVVTSLGAPASLEQALVEEWSGCTPKEAHGKLSQPDVAVTNQSDKDAQLPKLLSFNDEVKGALLGRTTFTTANFHAASNVHAASLPTLSPTTCARQQGTWSYTVPAAESCRPHSLPLPCIPPHTHTSLQHS